MDETAEGLVLGKSIDGIRTHDFINQRSMQRRIFSDGGVAHQQEKKKERAKRLTDTKAVFSAAKRLLGGSDHYSWD